MAKKKSKDRGSRRRRSGADMRKFKKRVCQFCTENTAVDWKDVATLRKFLSDRAKIRSRRVTGACPGHQREVATAIKNAREMALLPYVAQR